MKVIYLALKMIWKQKFLNILLIITIVLSIYYLSPVLSQVIHYAASAQALGRLEMDHSYYLYMNPNYSKRDASLKDSIDSKIESTTYVTGHAKSYHLYTAESTYNVISYNDTLIDNFKPIMTTGIWLDEAEKSDSIPVVVSQDTNLKCGETFPLRLISDRNQKSLSCKVVGIVKQKYIIGFISAADDDYFTTDAMLSNTAHTIILPFTKEIENFISDEAYLLSANGSILYTSAETTYEDVLSDFGYAGIVTDLGVGDSRFYENSKIIVVAMGAYFALYLIITIICLLCSNIILSTSTKKLYTIYFLTGMSTLKRIEIEVTRLLLLIFVSTTLSFLYLYKIGIIQSYFENTNSTFILSAILLYISLIFIPVSSVFILKNKNGDTIDSVRNLSTEI